MELDGKTALITGGTRIGRDTAEALAVMGCNVALTYHQSRERAEETAERVRGCGVRCLLAPADLTDPATPGRLMPLLEENLGGLDILVNMASVYHRARGGDPDTAPPGAIAADTASWRESLEVEAGSAYRLSIAAAPLMRRGGGGRVVNFSDWMPAGGRPRYRDRPAYYVAKAAVKAVTEMLALELAPDILVNAVAPGPVLPPADMPPEERDEVARQTPLRRWGGPGEVARAVVFLLQTDFITGECLRVDGGRHLY
jgi:NAD(P)-dependent dehydrogenase (short-subunit alcohol dehydrogenase family)